MSEPTEATAIEQLEVRVRKGIAWLSEHDPDGAFHFWYKAGITKLTPMPAQPEDVIERWVRYYDNRVAWEALFAKLERMGGSVDAVATA